MWVQERGGAVKPPPTPHDVHAIQTWFLDPDENEWIQTVLGPMGRQLAAQWRGAYRVPDAAITRKTKTASKRNPLSLLAAGVIVVALIGGVAVAAPALMGQTTASPAPSTAPAPTEATGPAPTVAASVEPTVAPIPEPTAPPATPAPTPRPPARPAGPSVTLNNGTVVYYTGPTNVTKGGTMTASFAVVLADGRPGAGSFAAILNDPRTVSNRRVAIGTLDGSGRIALSVQTNVQAGPYEMQFSYGGETRTIATVIVR